MDEGLFVRINGLDQWITIRGRDPRNPPLLILHGTGFAFSGLAPIFSEWEESFTLIQWDQPGCGATYGRSPDAAPQPLSFERLVRDAVAVLEFVRTRLDVPNVIVVGVSGGSILGLMLAKARPDLLSAYVGTGQIVNWLRQQALAYDAVLERARAAKDDSAVAALEAIGRPPYAAIASDAVLGTYAAAMTPAEQAAFSDPAVASALQNPPEGASYVARDIRPFDARAVSAAVFAQLKPEIAAFDARAIGTRFDVPLFFIQGRDDVYTATAEVQAYAADVEAPVVGTLVIDGGGHSAVFTRGAFLERLVRDVRPVY